MDLHPPIPHQDHQGPYEEGVLKISQELSSNEAKTKETGADNACCPDKGLGMFKCYFKPLVGPHPKILAQDHQGSCKEDVSKV